MTEGQCKKRRAVREGTVVKEGVEEGMSQPSPSRVSASPRTVAAGRGTGRGVSVSSLFGALHPRISVGVGRGS